MRPYRLLALFPFGQQHVDNAFIFFIFNKIKKVRQAVALLPWRHNLLEVELALQDINKPISVAEYKYLLPKEKLQNILLDELLK